MRPSSMHHHHNDLMTMTSPSELKFQGVLSSQTQRQAELTSRSSQCLMQWPSVVEHLVCSISCSMQPSLGTRSIKCVHHGESSELTSRAKEKKSSDPCIDILEVDDYILEKLSVDSHQEGRSSSTMVIRPQRRVDFHRRAEEHQSVIVLDYIFLTNPHQAHQTTAEVCGHDIARRVSSNIQQPKPSSGDSFHPRAGDEHLALEFINSLVILPSWHQVWPVHAVHLQAFHLCLHLLCVHLSLLSVLLIPPLHLLEDRDRPSQPQKAQCGMSSCILHLSIQLEQVHHYHLWSPQPHLHHLEHHQLLHHDLEAERGNDIKVIIFKFEMIISDEKDIPAYVHQHPHLFQSSVSAINFDIVDIIFKLEENINLRQHYRVPHLSQSPISAINFSIVDHILYCISGKLRDHYLMVLIHQDISVDHYSYAHPPQRPHR